jgi:hypothetical protein
MTDLKKGLLTSVGRFSFPSLSEPNSHPEYGDNKYQTEILIPKEVFKKEGKALLKAVLECAQEHMKVTVKGKKVKPTKLNQFKNPFRDGDAIYEEKGYDSYADCMAIRAKSQYQPIIIDAEKNDMTAEQIEAIKGGDYGRLLLNPYFYPQQGGGITFGLQLVQFWKAGEAFGGVAKDELISEVSELEVPLEEPDEEIEEDEEEEEEEAPKKKRKSAKRRAKKRTPVTSAPEVAEEENDDSEDNLDDDDEIDLDDL